MREVPLWQLAVRLGPRKRDSGEEGEGEHRLVRVLIPGLVRSRVQPNVPIPNHPAGDTV